MEVAPQQSVAVGNVAPVETIVSRLFTSFPGAKYVFASDEIEKSRLNRQHTVLKRAFEGRALLAPVSLQPGDSVLDSGTGTAGGVWLLDLAKNTPHTLTMQGIDIESRLFPSASSCPTNLTFSIASILDLPDDWSSRFSLVHQRLLLGALQRIEWPKAVEQMHRVLAPGGWVQLLEAGEWQSGPVNERHRTLIRALESSRGLMWDCYRHIPQMLADSGFINVHVEKRKEPMGKWAGQTGIEERDNLIDLWKSIKTPILKAGGLGVVNSEDELDKLLADLEKEWDETPGTFIEWVVIYAQKPF